MSTQTIEGTWEEILRNSRKYVGHRVRLTVLDEETKPTPNKKMLAALKRIERRSKNMPVSSNEHTQKWLREGRAGAMFGYEPIED